MAAQEKTAPRTFDLPSDTADKSLKRFAAQSGIEVAFGSATAAQVRTNPVKGSFSPREAIERMVAGTGLVVAADEKTGALTVSRGPNGQRAALTPSDRPVETKNAPAIPQSDELGSTAPIELSPFEVIASSDRGYVAASAITATRTNEKLENLPNSISVLTEELLKDLGVTTMMEAVEYAINAENVYNGQGTVGAQGGAKGGNTINFRGIPSLRQLRDGFPWFLDADAFNIERIELSRGPGGLAYGDVDPGGIINISTKRATFRRAVTVQGRYDSFDSHRVTLDANLPLRPDRLAVRLNAVDSRLNTSVQRKDNSLRAVAGAVRWRPFNNSRTQIDGAFETGDGTVRLGHLPLLDQTGTYVRGTGSSALDADLVRAGVQTNGVGMQRIANGNAKVFFDLGGTLYNMTATPANVFRFSGTLTNANAATGADPNNPLRIPRGPASFSIVPLGQDWGGPDTRHETRYDAYTLELKHTFADRFSVLLANNGQRDRTFRLQAYNNELSFGTSNLDPRSLFIDVNPTLPNPAGTGTIPNPRFEEYYVAHTPIKNNEKREIQNWRAVAVYDLKLPWNITQRLVGSGSYRFERHRTDYFTYALSRTEIARRGFTGAAATFPNNVVTAIHYLADGNSDAALRVREGADVAFYRNDPANNERFKNSLASASVSALGKYFGDRLHTSIGVSRDYWRQDMALAPVANALGELEFVARGGTPVGAGSVPVYPFSRLYSTNQTYGGVFRILPWLAVGAGYFESSFFSDGVFIDLFGQPFEPRTGEGADYSLRFNLLDDRVHATVTYYETVSENNRQVVAANVRNELNALLSPSGPLRIVNNRDYKDQTSHGYEFEIVANPTRNVTLRAAYYDNSTEFTRFFPLLRGLLAEAQIAASARGLDPAAATTATREFLAEQETLLVADSRRGASLAARYTFIEGRLKGLALGTAARYAPGRPIESQSVGGELVIPAYDTPNDLIVNPFASYRRKLGRQTWELRLNINNVFDRRSNQAFNAFRPRYTEPRQIIGSVAIEF